MTRIYDNRGMATRSNLSVAILGTVLLYGIWEFFHVATYGGDQSAWLFAVIFVGGAGYGLRKTLAETRNLVIGFEVDQDTGKALVFLWRPFQMKKIATSLDQLTNWRHWLQVGPRGQRAFFLLVDDPSEGTIRFELRPGMNIPDTLRKIAPEAFRDFERETGVIRDEPVD